MASTPDPYASPDPGARPPQSPYGPPPGYPPASGYGPPPAYAGPTRTEPKAWIALGLAIGAYLPILPFFTAIAALVVAHYARRDIRASGGTLTGLGLCTWAVVLSVVHLVFIVLLVLLFLLVFAAPFTFL